MSPITSYNDRAQFISNDLYPLGKKKKQATERQLPVCSPKAVFFFKWKLFAEDNKLFLLMRVCIIYLYNTVSDNLK